MKTMNLLNHRHFGLNRKARRLTADYERGTVHQAALSERG
jgi:hypothetical protein